MTKNILFVIIITELIWFGWFVNNRQTVIICTIFIRDETRPGAHPVALQGTGYIKEEHSRMQDQVIRQLLIEAKLWLDIACESGISARDEMNLPTPNADHIFDLSKRIDVALAVQVKP